MTESRKKSDKSAEISGRAFLGTSAGAAAASLLGNNDTADAQTASSPDRAELPGQSAEAAPTINPLPQSAPTIAVGGGINKLISTVAGLLLLAVTTPSTGAELIGPPEAEFHMARLVYSSGNAGRTWRPWWAIDYPDAEYHFTRGLRRLTSLDVADDSQHLKLTDEGLFDYPWLFAQQVGHWYLDEDEITRLREYVLRGGFVVVDDFHGEYEWVVFSDVMRRAFPEWPITPLPETHPLMNVLYDLDQDTQIPGRRHLYRDTNGKIEAMLRGPAQWHGVYDENERLVVAINFNMDMGDAWEHADDPVYPVPMTSLAYRFAVNYVIYAMTH